MNHRYRTNNAGQGPSFETNGWTILFAVERMFQYQNCSTPKERLAATISQMKSYPRTKRFFKRMLWFIATMLVVIFLFYGVENWRAKRAFQQHLDWLASKGETLDPKAFAPQPIPDADNAAFAPVFDSLYSSNGSSGESQWATEDFSKIPRNLSKSQKSKLKAWHQYIQLGNLFSMPPENEDGSVDISKWVSAAHVNAEKRDLKELLPDTPLSDWEQLTYVSDKYSVKLDGVRAAGTRSACLWMQVSVENPVFPATISLAIQKSLFLDSLVLFHQQQPEKAHQNMLAQLRFASAQPNPPNLIRYLIRKGLEQYTLSSLKLAISAHQWTDSQWVQVAQNLEIPDVISSLKLLARGERSYTASTFYSKPWKLPELPAILKDVFKTPWFHRYYYAGPSGWRERNQITSSLLNQKVIDSLVPGKRPLLEAFLSLKGTPSNSPYEFLSVDNFKIFATSPSAALAAHMDRMQLAPVAIALERYRLKHGEFPPALEAIVGEFLPSLPESHIDARLPSYEKLANGSFKLWFWGLDGDDDHGQGEVMSKFQDEGNLDMDLVIHPGPALP